MAQAKAKVDPQAAQKKQARKLALELLQIHVDNAKTFGRIDAIKAELKKIAGDVGNFKEVELDVGQVAVSAPKAKSFKGTVPAVNAETFLALPEKERERLTTKGIVEMVDEYTGAYYGAVTVDLF